MQVDKVVLTNMTALSRKYDAAALQKISTAIRELISADKKRGITAQMFCLDDKADMDSIGASPVTDANDPKQNKVAVDSIFAKINPSYLVIVGSIDVVPHQDLKNPIYDASPFVDPDILAWGDIPYACEAPYSQDVNDFLGPTRVTGRIPDLTGGHDPDYLVNLLRTATVYQPSDLKSYRNYLGISAEIWKKSTDMSLLQTFGSTNDLKTVPPHSEKWSKQLLSKKMHFINCHGADTESKFYGQPANGEEKFPVAMDALELNGKIKEGTVAAAECCYGGQLFDPSILNGQIGICNIYLSNDAYGFFASTTIAYGPSDSNAQADLICQYFLQGVLRGASLGRAALEARQNFVKTASPLNPADLKTLAQFNLYGDPSITPITIEDTPNILSVKASQLKAISSHLRRERRRKLFSFGYSLANSEPRSRRLDADLSQPVKAALRKEARNHGIDPVKIISFAIEHTIPANSFLPMALRIASGNNNYYHVVLGSRKKKGSSTTSPVNSISMLIAKESDGLIVSIDKIVSR